jgi:hypothetical protein
VGKLIKVEWNYSTIENSRGQRDPIYISKDDVNTDNHDESLSLTPDEAEMLIGELRLKLNDLAK